MNPIDYAINVKTPFEQAVGGLQTGLALSDIGIKRQQEQLKLQDQERARQQQIQMQTDLAALAAKPNATANDYSAIMTRYPQISEHLKRGYEILQPEQQRAKLSTATQAYAALNAGQPDVAIKLLTDQAEAQRNSGNEAEAKAAEAIAKIIEVNPATAKATAGLYLSSIAGADKFATMFPALQKEERDTALAPGALTAQQAENRKKKADADLAEITSRYGEKNAITDLAKKGWDIKKIEADIGLGKENARIAAMNAATNRMNAGTQRDELNFKVTEAVAKRDDKLREKVAEVTSARTTIDNALNTVDRILKNKELDSVVGSIQGRLPAVFDDVAADAISLLDTFKSQVFLAQIPAIKGTGNLSEREGDKLEQSLQNLGRVQSESQLRENLKEAQRLMLKARGNLTKFGVPESVPDTPSAAAQTSAGKSTDDILRELGVVK